MLVQKLSYYQQCALTSGLSASLTALDKPQCCDAVHKICTQFSPSVSLLVGVVKITINSRVETPVLQLLKFTCK